MAELTKQLSIGDIYTECAKYFEEDKPKLISLLKEHIDISDYIPFNFYNAFYKILGRKRKYPLYSLISMLILQKVMSIPSDSLLLTILKNSKELRELCGLVHVPDASKITRFRSKFVPFFEAMFNDLVTITEPICNKINEKRSSMLIFDTSGIEAHVTENNPKQLNHTIRQLKKQYKNESDAYKIVQVSMIGDTYSKKYNVYLNL